MERFFNTILRYRLLHVLYWGYFLVSSLHELQVNRPEPVYAEVNIADPICETLFRALSVYVCLWIWMPRYLKGGRLWRFVLQALATVLLSAALCVAVQDLYIRVLMDPAPGFSTMKWLISFLAYSVNIATSTALFIVVALAHHYYMKDRRSQRMERERMRAELDLLKAQINPHFLFNALNSIHVLMKVDPPQAEQALLRFSSMLRHQLYDCSGERTPLGKEVAFIRDYVDLERLRSGDALQVSFAVPERLPPWDIAPFLLLPFVENAFKHVSRSRPGGDRIAIALSIAGPTLRFNVRNTVRHNGIPSSPGIGLPNVRRRLELLYPGAHVLRTAQDDAHYAVNLELRTDGAELPGDR
jgi:hypothetical protein